MRRHFEALSRACRQLAKNFSFTCLTVLTLALGIGAATAIFSLVHGVLLAPLPFQQPERLQQINTLEFPHGRGRLPVTSGSSISTSFQNLFDWRDQNHSFQSIAGYRQAMYLFGSEGGARAQEIYGAQATSGLFETLGVAPQIGRTFRKDEEKPGNRSIILSHKLWVSDFGSDPNVIGRKVSVSDQTATVIGVLPAKFRFPILQPVAFWMTCSRGIEEAMSHGEDLNASGSLEIVARLKPKITREEANAELNAIQSSLSDSSPATTDRYATEVVSELSGITSNVDKPLRLLMAAVLLLLLIACSNVTGLMLTRASRRSSEMAIRVSLGANGWQIIKLSLIEALLLGLWGGIAGAGIGWGLLHACLRSIPPNLPRLSEVSLDLPALAFAFGMSVLTAVLAGVLPAWRLSWVNPSLTMREKSSGATGSQRQHRIQSGMLVAQTALSLVLLVGAGLLIRSFDALLHVNPGFDPKNLLQFSVALTEQHYSQSEMEQFARRLLPRLRACSRYLRASTMRAKLRKPMKRTSSFSNREKVLRKPLSLRNSRSISLRFL